ncbi:MAG: hypothetical protein IT292_11370 [Deltaproteobacteria bacterium]|nr:hypothetical protein [Deltaproteobacteria bacterium]
MSEQNSIELGRGDFSRDDVLTLIAEVEKEIGNGSVLMHSMLLLDALLRQPNGQQILDDELKGRLIDIWQRVKLAGLQLNDPPLLFGQPKVATAEVVSSDDISDGTEAIKFTLPQEEEPKSKKGQKKKRAIPDEDLIEESDDDEGEEEDDSSVEEE